MHILNKNVVIFLSLVLFCFCLLFPTTTSADQQLPNIHAASYIVMDHESGTILAAQNPDQPRPPASMTKMMTQFVILDLIKQGKLSWDETVTVSERAAAIDEAQIHLVPNEKIKIKELFIAMAVQSANDATVALAEHVAGSEEKFVAMMNQKAKELGMTKSHFWNSTGLNKASYPDPPSGGGDETHWMSARDTAMLASQLLHTHPEVIEFTSLSKYTFFKGTDREKEYYNWNRMLPGLQSYYQGVDGFKTGHTNAAGYCFTGTAKRGSFRIMTVVMGTPSQVARFNETKKLMDYSFNHYVVKTLISAQNSIPKHGHLPIPNGVERTVPVVVQKQIRLPVSKKEPYTYRVTFKKHLQAPLSKGTVVGEVDVLYKGKKLDGYDSIPLVTYKDIEKGSWLRLTLRSTVDWFKSLF